ncbi:magnesium/cobalt transporter CorA [Coriobacteriia bacterium Es71-Z0120]|uniref:magnesium/cobalt transporter CorA n=1 Tax=Parvivirga hydrogeniphila TaxID=2939460 RepID=UPI002261045C|nr:magnesium/cobalt transporter CorA [Parvivirga hydrogeniphila]MCL4079711.1 magnesium/cobalt transporter CorA [Parvivirga hydrogeniphila]
MSAAVTVRWIEDGVLRAGGLDALATLPPDAVVWADVLDPDEPTLLALAKRFPMHPLAIEDCLHFPQRPKIDVYPDSTFAIWLVPLLLDEDGVATHELDVFLGAEHLVTVHREAIKAVDDVASEAATFTARGVEWTLHAILDRAVDALFPVVEQIADALEELEDAMLADARTEHLSRLYAAKRALVQLHKILVPERDVVRGLARLEAFVEPDAYMYFQDIGDHLARAIDSVETYRDVATGAMDIYLSAQSNRMNEIMKQLTVIATIFMPLTLISSIYGMNFRYMPELEWRYGYFAVLAVMAFIAAWMVWFFRRRRWW